jgi:signal transduction histidine kinase
VTIEDSGAGIEQSQRVAAFDPYRRGVTKAAGTGLGLATVKRYVEAAGGTVWLEESDLGGLKATFVIPASVSVQPRLAA